MSSTFLAVLPRLLFVCLVFLAGFGLGHKLGRAPLLVQLAEAKASAAELGHMRAMAAARALTSAQQLGDQLTTGLSQSQAQINSLQKDKANAIRRLTSDSRCLGPAAVRMLNSTAPPTSPAAGLPKAASNTATEDGTFATDTDVGQWINTAQSQYAECSARLDALIDFNTHQPAVAGADFEN